MIDDLKFYSLSELMEYARSLPRLWGPWRLDRENLQLVFIDQGEWIYDVDLERCTDSEGMLDWIMQVNGKSWAEDDRSVVAGLVDALDDVLHPQANMCSGGVGKAITKEKLVELVEKAAAAWPERLIESEGAK